MTLRQTALGLAVASGLLVGMSACGGDDKTATASDLPTSVPTDASASATPTPVDPTAAAKAKVLKDYQEFLDVRARGLLSNSPGYPYEQVMTGNALQTAKSYVGGMALINAKFSGSYKYLQGSVVALNLKAQARDGDRTGLRDGLDHFDEQGRQGPERSRQGLDRRRPGADRRQVEGHRNGDLG